MSRAAPRRSRIAAAPACSVARVDAQAERGSNDAVGGTMSETGASTAKPVMQGRRPALDQLPMASLAAVPVRKPPLALAGSEPRGIEAVAQRADAAALVARWQYLRRGTTL